MIQIKTRALLLCAAVAALLSSCKKEPRAECLPYQEKEDGRWGLVKTDGEVLFADEFKEQPTVAMNDRFMVKNKEGLWEIYTAEKKPRKVGGEYVTAGLFYEDVAPVAERGKPIDFIDKDGNVKFTLDKVNGKRVQRVSNFQEGLAIFETDSLYGCIDTEGNVVIEPEYCQLSSCRDGKLAGVHKKYKRYVDDNKPELFRYTILDNKGKELSSFKGDRFASIGGYFIDGLMTASEKRDDEEIWGLIDEKGEWVVKPSSRVKGIGWVKEGLFTFYDGDKWGLMNTKGENVIRAKYDFLYFVADDRLAAVDRSADEDAPYYLLDTEGNKIGTDSYRDMGYFYDKEHMPVQYGKNSWIFIDKDGKEAKSDADMRRIDVSNWGDTWVESNFVDLPGLARNIGLAAGGMDGLSFASSLLDVIRRARSCGNTSLTLDAEDYNYNKNISYEKPFEGTAINFYVTFDQYIGTAVTETVRENYGYYYYDSQRVTGYRFNETHPQEFVAAFDESGKLKGKLKPLYKELAAQAKRLGKTVKENSNAVVVSAGGNTILACFDGDRVMVAVGRGDIGGQIDIEQYADAKETTQYSDDLAAPAEEEALDSTVAEEFLLDSAAVDSVAF